MQVLKSARYLKIFNIANIQYLLTISSLTQFCRSQSLKLFNTYFLRNNAFFCVKKTVLYKKPTSCTESMFLSCYTEIISKFTLCKQTLIESVLKCLFPRCQEWKFWKKPPLQIHLKRLRTFLHFVDVIYYRNKMLLFSFFICFDMSCSSSFLIYMLNNAVYCPIRWYCSSIEVKNKVLVYD